MFIPGVAPRLNQTEWFQQRPVACNIRETLDPNLPTLCRVHVSSQKGKVTDHNNHNNKYVGKSVDASEMKLGDDWDLLQVALSHYPQSSVESIFKGSVGLNQPRLCEEPLDGV